MKQNTASALAAIVVTLMVTVVLKAATPEQVCPTSTWMNCGLAMKQALAANPSDPKAILSLAGVWGTAYDRRFEELRRAGHLEKSTPDAEKIFEKVKSKLDPVDIATDKVTDELAKKYLPRLATLLKWAENPIVKALRVFFDSSEIASDRDELDLMNNDLQTKIATLLAPSLTSDWKQKLLKATSDAAPEIKPAP